MKTDTKMKRFKIIFTSIIVLSIFTIIPSIRPEQITAQWPGQDWSSGGSQDSWNWGFWDDRECCDKENLIHSWCSNMDPDCSACDNATVASQPIPTFSFQQARCECDHVEVVGTPKVGETLTFNAYAKVKDPFMADQKTNSMIFTILKDGNKILTTPEVSTTGPTRSTDSETGEQIDLYQASLDYVISDVGNYHLDVLNTCMNIQAKNPFSVVQKVHASENFQEAAVEQVSLWDKIVGFFQKLGKKENVEGIYDENTDENVLAEVDEQETIKLGTFAGDAQIATGCRSADFSVAN